MASNLLSSARSELRISKRLVLSYVIDWIVVIGIAGLGAGLSRITPYHRPFDLTNPEISFPYVDNEQISTAVLGVIAVVAPAVIIFLICLFLVPGPGIRKGMPMSAIYRLKLWEWHAGWLGLALALATTLLFTEGMKNLFGKPRPDLLSRCDPDLANIARTAVGGFGGRLTEGVTLVSSAICRQRDKGILNGGFKSFPSGHASFSFAGLTYLTLFICSKFALRIPYLLSYSHSSTSPNNAFSTPPNSLPTSEHKPSLTLIRHQSAAPPVYLLIPALIPIGAAVYISSTRYTDFRHHGFDILFGATLGFVLAWASFRMYHLPVTRGAGWSWGPRNADRAWGVGVGVSSYADVKGWDQEENMNNNNHSTPKEQWPSSSRSDDIEAGMRSGVGTGATATTTTTTTARGFERHERV